MFDALRSTTITMTLHPCTPQKAPTKDPTTKICHPSLRFSNVSTTLNPWAYMEPKPRNAGQTLAAWSPSIGPLERAAEMEEEAASSLAVTATWAPVFQGLLRSFNP